MRHDTEFVLEAGVLKLLIHLKFPFVVITPEKSLKTPSYSLHSSSMQMFLSLHGLNVE